MREPRPPHLNKAAVKTWLQLMAEMAETNLLLSKTVTHLAAVSSHTTDTVQHTARKGSSDTARKDLRIRSLSGLSSGHQE